LGARAVGRITEGQPPEDQMSLAKMFSMHPDAHGVNELLAMAARHSMFCASMCASCADACSAEKMDMRQCIRTCSDCADICEATAKLSVRRTGQNIEMLKAMMETCVKACELCAAECEKHDHDHCRLCAEMCRECARDCRKALPTIN
jgi:hypothetical protein